MAGPLPSRFDEQPARLRTRPMPAAGPWTGLATERVELISRGDIVTGVWVRSAATAAASPAAPAAALLLLHDTGSHASGPEWGVVARWVSRGAQALAIDLPLHGRRTSPKLTERLLGALASLDAGRTLDREGEVLAEEALRQGHCDAARALEALLALESVDPKRVGLVGIGFGCRAAEDLLRDERRAIAAVLIDARSERPAPPAGTDSPAAILRLAPDRDAAPDRGRWADEAERFLASRLGI